MKILALYPFLPYPVVSGAAQRGCYILDILASKHDVTLISFVGRDDSPSDLRFWKSYSLFARKPITVLRRTEEEISPMGRRLRASRQRSRVLAPEGLDFFDVPAMWNRIAELDIGQFDAVHVRFAGMIPYAVALKQVAPQLRLVVDLDDNPSLLLSRKLISSLKKFKFRMFIWQLKELIRTFAFELKELQKFDSVWICSDIDSSRMSSRIGSNRIQVVENIVDAQELAAIDRSNIEPAVLMIASFDYEPNKAGAEFFVAKVWPRITSVIPEAQLWLVGKNSQLQEWSGKQGILVTGMVDDVRPYLERAMISVAPIFVGTGTKLKILEALGAGLPVVTTTIGAEGIDVVNGVDLLIANTPEDFADYCIRLLTDRKLRDELASSGKGLIQEKYDLHVMARKVLDSYDILAKPVQTS